MADGDDWTTWLNQHGAALVLLARRYVTSQADAEDVVQEAFVRCWKSRERVEEPVAFLYACVKHGALDWRRGKQRQTRREEQASRTEAEPLFLCSAEQAERQAAIEAAIGELPAEQAEVLVMKIWGGLTFEQIAQALELSANTAASRYRYAVAKLRAALAEEPSYE